MTNIQSSEGVILPPDASNRLELPSTDVEVLRLEKPFIRTANQTESYLNALLIINDEHPGFISQRIKDGGVDDNKRARWHTKPVILFDSGFTFPLTEDQQIQLNKDKEFEPLSKSLQVAQLKESIRLGGNVLAYYGKAGCIGFDCDGSDTETPNEQKEYILDALGVNESQVLILPSWSHYKKGSFHVVVKAEKDVCDLRDTTWKEGQHLLAAKQRTFLHWDNSERLLEFLNTQTDIITMDQIDRILSVRDIESSEKVEKKTKSLCRNADEIGVINEIKEKYSMLKCMDDLFGLSIDGDDLFDCPYNCTNRPSARIYEEKVFHCFSCETHMDIFDAYKKERGLSFPDAVKELSNKAGVDVKASANGESKSQCEDEKESITSKIEALEDIQSDATGSEWNRLQLEISKLHRQLGEIEKKEQEDETNAKNSVFIGKDYGSISCTEDLVEYLWKNISKWFWVNNSEYYYVDDKNKLVRSLKIDQIRHNIKGTFEEIILDIKRANKMRKKYKLDEISVSEAINCCLSRVEVKNALANAVDMPFRSRFFKACKTDKALSLNTSTIELAFVDDKGVPEIEDPEAFLNTFLYERWCLQYGDALPSMLDNFARHYYNIHHGKYKWGEPKKGWRDRIIVIIGRKDDGKTLTAAIHSSLFGMSMPKQMKEWLGGATIFNEGANYPVIMYDDPEVKNRYGYYGNRFYDTIFSSVSNGLLDLNIKRKFQGTVPFNGMLFAMVNNDKQIAVLPDRFVTDLLDKVLLIKCVEGVGPVFPDEGRQMEKDAATLPAFYLDRVENMGSDVLNNRFVGSHWIDPELMSESREEHGVEDRISLVKGISDLFNKFDSSVVFGVQKIDTGNYSGWKRIRIRHIYDELKYISEISSIAAEDKNNAIELMSDYPKNKKSGEPYHESNIFKMWKKISELKDSDIKVARQRVTLGDGARDDTRLVPYLLWRTETSTAETAIIKEPF